MSETITILRACGRRLAKLIQKDGSIIGYDKARLVDLHERDVPDLPALHALLRQLVDRPDCCVVRGGISSPAHTRRVRRLLHDDAAANDVGTLREEPRR